MKGPAAEADSPASSPDGPSPTCQTRHSKETEKIHAVCLAHELTLHNANIKAYSITLKLLFWDIFHNISLFLTVATLWPVSLLLVQKKKQRGRCSKAEKGEKILARLNPNSKWKPGDSLIVGHNQ